MTELAIPYEQTANKTTGLHTLRDSVKSTVENYLKQLDGHPAGQLYDMFLQEVETPLLEAILLHVRGNQSKAAELLGINRGTLRKKLKIYGLHQ